MGLCNNQGCDLPLLGFFSSNLELGSVCRVLLGGRGGGELRVRGRYDNDDCCRSGSGIGQWTKKAIDTILEKVSHKL